MSAGLNRAIKLLYTVLLLSEVHAKRSACLEFQYFTKCNVYINMYVFVKCLKRSV